MVRVLVVLFCSIITLVLTPPVFAGIGKEMENLFSAMGGGGNYTSGAAYKTQSAGYYMGGSLYARVPTKNYQLLNFQPPSLNLGCGGIDAFLGAFSHIRGEELVKALRNISNNAGPYAFNLALQTFVPQIYNTMQKLNDIAREINSLNINSCQTSAQLLGSVWAKNDEASRYLCQQMGAANNILGDYAASRHGCGTGGKRDEVNSGKKGEFKDQIGDEFNIAWEAIKKQNIFGKEKELAELFMSISGTIVQTKEGQGSSAKLNTKHFVSLINNTELFDMLLFGESRTGEQPKIYRCGKDKEDKEKCLHPKLEAFSINKDSALVPKIDASLREMSIKMRTHSGELTDVEKSLVNMTQIPIQTIIAVQNSFTLGNSVINITEFTEAIAYDYVLNYMEKVLDFVSLNLSNLERVQIVDRNISEFKKDIATVRKEITDKKYGAYQRMLAVISVIEKSNMVEKKLNQMFTSYAEMKREA